MPQIFLDYNGQVDKLVSEKDLIVNDRDFAVEMLTRYGYFSLIGGYKNIYINKSVRKYKKFAKDLLIYRYFTFHNLFSTIW